MIFVCTLKLLLRVCEKTAKNLLAHAPDLVRRIVVLKVGDLVRAASFVFDEKLAAVFPDRLDRLRLDVGVAAWKTENVPSNALAGYAITINEPSVMDAVNQTRTPLAFWRVEPGAGLGCTRHNTLMACC